ARLAAASTTEELHCVLDPSFVPGKADKHGQFLISQRLYGRTREVAQLLSAYDALLQAECDGPHCVFVGGWSGAGERYTTALQQCASYNARHEDAVPSRCVRACVCVCLGKTALVDEVHKSMVSNRGLYAKAKFDLYKRNNAVLFDACQSLMAQLLAM